MNNESNRKESRTVQFTVPPYTHTHTHHTHTHTHTSSHTHIKHIAHILEKYKYNKRSARVNTICIFVPCPHTWSLYSFGTDPRLYPLVGPPTTSARVLSIVEFLAVARNDIKLSIQMS